MVESASDFSLINFVFIWRQFFIVLGYKLK